MGESWSGASAASCVISTEATLCLEKTLTTALRGSVPFSATEMVIVPSNEPDAGETVIQSWFSPASNTEAVHSVLDVTSTVADDAPGAKLISASLNDMASCSVSSFSHEKRVTAIINNDNSDNKLYLRIYLLFYGRKSITFLLFYFNLLLKIC